MESKHLHLNFCYVSASGRIHVNRNCMFHSGCCNYVQQQHAEDTQLSCAKVFAFRVQNIFIENCDSDIQQYSYQIPT